MNKSLPPTHFQPVGRLFVVDLLKAISIAAVVSYHAVFVPQSTYASSASLIDLLFAPLRFCVPIFLTISFLLLERGLTNRPDEPAGSLIKKRLIRLAIPTAFWFSLAAALKLLKGMPITQLLGEIATGEIFTGAYYLLIMFQLIPLYIWSRRWLSRSRNSLITILIQGVVFVAIAVALASELPLISILRALDRPLFIYWFGYIALGILIYKKFPLMVEVSAQISTRLKALLIFLTGATLTAEYGFLSFATQNSVPPFDYLMLSCILAVAVAFFCFASVDEKQVPLPLRNFIGLLSKYSLGIFCINGIVRQVFLSFGSRWFAEASFSFTEILAMKLIGWCVLLAISLGLSVLISKSGWKAIVC